jgi:hypothetical protein
VTRKMARKFTILALLLAATFGVHTSAAAFDDCRENDEACAELAGFVGCCEGTCTCEEMEVNGHWYWVCGCACCLVT